MDPYNFCPRCGTRFEMKVRDDERLRPACPNCGYTVYANPPLAVGVVAMNREGQVVLIRRGENPGRGLWGLPAGFMERDETTEEAARRECFEETALEISLGELWGVYSYIHKGRKTSGVLILYRALVTGGSAQAGTDSTEVKFFASDEIPFDSIAFETHKDALRRWQALVRA